MSGKFRRIYPGEDRIFLDGGKNSKFERSIIQDNESPDCKNVVFTNGAAETRQGFTKLNTTAAGSYVCDGLYTRRDDTGSETMCAWFGGHMFALGTTTFVTIPSAQSVFTAGVRVAASQYENYMFIGNGGIIPHKWNGTTFTRHGVYPPTSANVGASAAFSIASNGAGNCHGDYRYKLTFVNSNSVESDVGDVTSTFTASNSVNRLTSLPVAPTSFGVNARRVYRTTAGGTSFKRVAEVADNTTTTYDDNIADASLGVTAPTDNGVPPNYSVICYHQNRLFCNDPANPNYVWYSDLGDPYTFSSTNYIKVGDSASDLVKGLSVYDNALVVYCEKSIWMIYMSSTTESEWSPPYRIKSAYGSKSPFSYLDFNSKQLFPAMQNDKFVGFGTLSGNAVETSATLLTIATMGSDLESTPVETDMFDVIENKVGNISGIVFKNKAWIALTYGSGSTTNNRVYQFDFSTGRLNRKQEGSWVPFTGMNAAQFTIYGGELYFGTSTATGFVYKAEAGVYSDDGSAIDSYIWTKEFSGSKGEESYNKDFRYANVLLEKAGDYFMNIAYRVNSDSGDGNVNQVDLDPGGSLWGSMMWGRDLWGGGDDQEDVRLSLGTARGKRIQFKFSNQNTAGQRFKVHGLNFAYNLRGYR